MRFFIETLLKSIPLFLPLIGIFYAEQYRLLATLAYFPIFFVVEYLLVYRPSKKLEERRKDILNVYFKRWVENARINKQKPRIRINVMLVKTWFTGKHLFQFYGYNMKGWPDADLHLSVKSGLCGSCLEQRCQEAYFEDLRGIDEKTAKQRFQFNKEQYELTKHIKAIVCVPLVKTRKSWLSYGEKQDFFGVLNVDTVDDIGIDFLQNDKTLEDIYNFALFIERVFE